MVAHVFAIEARIATAATAMAVFLSRTADVVWSPLLFVGIDSSPNSLAGTWSCVYRYMVLRLMETFVSRNVVYVQVRRLVGALVRKNIPIVLGWAEHHRERLNLHLNGSPRTFDGAIYRELHVLCPRKECTQVAANRAKNRAIDRAEIIKSEWTVLVGESAVAIGSIIVVLGLIRAFRAIVREHRIIHQLPIPLT